MTTGAQGAGSKARLTGFVTYLSATTELIHKPVKVPWDPAKSTPSIEYEIQSQQITEATADRQVVEINSQ